jgi:hypothetical protein
MKRPLLLGVKRLLGLPRPAAISPIARSVRDARLTYLSDVNSAT